MKNTMVKQWFPIYTKPKREALAKENLARQGYETYLPRIKLKRRYRGKWTERVEPLFPRYLFIRLEQGKDNFAPIRFTIGVTDMVRFNGKPSALPSGTIGNLKDREVTSLGIHVSEPSWKPGSKVELTQGPFAGMNGIFQEESGEKRVLVLLTMLGRENHVIIERDSVIPIEE